MTLPSFRDFATPKGRRVMATGPKARSLPEKKRQGPFCNPPARFKLFTAWRVTNRLPLPGPVPTRCCFPLPGRNSHRFWVPGNFAAGLKMPNPDGSVIFAQVRQGLWLKQAPATTRVPISLRNVSYKRPWIESVWR